MRRSMVRFNASVIEDSSLWIVTSDTCFVHESCIQRLLSESLRES